MARPPPRPINRLLVCNRGEIATRIITAARELSIPTYAVYTSNDTSHVRHATRAIELPSASSYMDIPYLIALIKQHDIDAVHPGYGFLSESAEFARRTWEEAGAAVVGPGWEILEQTGDKLKARKLAEECSVPVAPALLHPTSSIPTLGAFASSTGYPIMIKAVDGGGGRGIRLVRSDGELERQAARAIEESPSRRVYAERAMVDGFRHVEVQMVGDGRGEVRHLWERECSVQRRWQKVVEEAPSTIADRAAVGEVIGAAVRMAEKLAYFSLGTFEFLLHPATHAFYFLEINPRLQVEHTVTEALLPGLDLVQTQLVLHQHRGPRPLRACPGIPPAPAPACAPPPHPLHAIQLRLAAEDPARGFALGTGAGAVASLRLPDSTGGGGPGVRVDTHRPSTVGADFDGLLAKIVVAAASREACVRRARRALADVGVDGVATNLGLLRAVVASADFGRGQCDTGWLEGEGRVEGLVGAGEEIERGIERERRGVEGSGFAVWEEARGGGGGGGDAAGLGGGRGSSSTVLFRKGDAWKITLETPPRSEKEGAASGKKATASAPASAAPTHHLELTRVLRNDFPSSLSAEVVFSSNAADTGAPSSSSSSTPYVMHLAATTASSSAALSQNRRGRPDDPSHVCIPFAGKVVEVLVDEGDVVKEGDVVCVVRQMKMELEVRSARAGRATWVFEGEEGDEVSEGTLACILELENKEKARL